MIKKINNQMQGGGEWVSRNMFLEWKKKESWLSHMACNQITWTKTFLKNEKRKCQKEVHLQQTRAGEIWRYEYDDMYLLGSRESG